MDYFLHSPGGATTSVTSDATNASIAGTSRESSVESLPPAYSYLDQLQGNSHRVLGADLPIDRLAQAWATARTVVTSATSTTAAEHVLRQLVRQGHRTFLVNNREGGRSLLELAAISECFAGAEAVCILLPELVRELDRRVHEGRHTLTVLELENVLSLHAWAVAVELATCATCPSATAYSLRELVRWGHGPVLLTTRQGGHSLLELAAISESFEGAEAVCTVLPELVHEVLEGRHSLTALELEVVQRVLDEMAP